MESKSKKEQKIEALTQEIQKSVAKIELLSASKKELKTIVITFLDQDEKLKSVRKTIDKIEDCVKKISKHEKLIDKAKQKLEKLILKSVEPEVEIIFASEEKLAPKETPSKPKARVRKSPITKVITNKETSPKPTAKIPAKPRARKPRNNNK